MAKAKITHLHVDFVYLGVDLLPLVSDILGVLLDGAQVLFGLLQLGSSLVEGLGEKVLADGELLSGRTRATARIQIDHKFN